MRTELIDHLVCAICLSVLVAACKEGASSNVTNFDAAAIAREADRGHSEPLNALLDACEKEARAIGKRGEVCDVLNKVWALRKPIAAPRF